MSRLWKLLPLLLPIVLGAGLSACASDAPKKKFDYGTQVKSTPLEVPPDLVKPLDNDTLGATDAALARADTASVAVLPAYPDMRIARAGDTRWLIVKQAPEKLWLPVREFLVKQGLEIASENQTLGILETEWADNRANASGNLLQKYLGKVAPALFSSGIRDQYRVRFERTAEGASEIYLSHRGLEEVAVTDGNPFTSTKTIWQRRAPDPELEAEMLHLLMQHLGAPEKQAQAAVAAPSAPARAQLMRVGDSAVLQLDETLENAWQRVGQALDRLGYPVQERDRAKGIYYFRYLDAAAQDNKSFFPQVGASDSANNTGTGEDYQLRLEARAPGVALPLYNRKGVALAPKDAEPILKSLEKLLK